MNAPDPDQITKAQELIINQKIKKIKGDNFENFYVVTGSREIDHLVVLPNFCSCEDFQVRGLKTPGKVCYHIVGASMAKKVPADDFPEWYTLLNPDR
ncbi:MAG: hypothetical protein IH840_06255 [Candidatus Heimdallarchaeota archaeon]|nr:hypothetical protein [Candidatus Heimdallarchaeota archaeon]